MAKREELELPPSTTLRRLFHDAADGAPGLVIDLYGDVARIDVHEGPLAKDLAAIAAAVKDARPSVRAVCSIVRPKGGGQQAKLNAIFGDIPAGLIVHERGCALLVRLLKHGAPLSGAFVDLREGRRLAASCSRGRPGLNLFAHAGAFGAAMATGGASKVTHVDSAKSCAPWAALNLALNGIDPRQHKFVVDDAFKVLRRLAKRGPAFGVIAADPPTTGARKGGRFVVADALVPLATDACRALLDDGTLLLSTNDRRIEVNDVEACAREGAHLAGRSVAACDAIAMPADLMPNGLVEGDLPVRGVCLRLR